MTNIKTINLTEKDFQLMVDGLDALPNRDAAGEMMGDLMFGLLSKGDDTSGMSDAKREIDNQKAKRKRERELLTEDVRILQGKLLMLKRYLIENNLMEQAAELLN